MHRGGEAPDDLDEYRALHILRRWLEEDEEGRAFVARLERDPPAGLTALRQRLERAAPPEVQTHLSGGTVGKLVNLVSEVASVHIYEDAPERRSLLSAVLQLSSGEITVGATEICLVRVHNADAEDHEVALQIYGFFQDFSSVRSNTRFIVPTKGHFDARIDIMVPEAMASRLFVRDQPLEIAVTALDDSGLTTREIVTLKVQPFHDVHLEVTPPSARSTWRPSRGWVYYRLDVQNRGNQIARVAIGHAEDAALSVEVEQDHAVILPGDPATLEVRARPLRPNYFWADRVAQFQLSADASPNGRWMATAELRQAPLLSQGVLIFLVVVLAGLLWLAKPSPISTPGPADHAVATRAEAPPMTRAEASPATSSEVPSTIVTERTPAAVVRGFFRAIDQHQYDVAWDLGGKNLARRRGRTRQEFVDGYHDTDSERIERLSVQGEDVTATVVADEEQGRQRSTYTFRYRVRAGEIQEGHACIAARIRTDGRPATISPKQRCDGQ